ncbi:uncharacterized protein LOC111867222 isoform X4 [Cryptotermes secundus]|uniref:uncharacterized protein LOC111867222 isoform X4 n=1 Tax=Cryptotermes secundus TaxID=105785 RepID=UPI000CD7C3B9|nr:uncharacterized protein LOC111867222 isoform X4 [Cryptotermes secundus]
MQFGGAFSYQTEPDSWCEPLNLVKKKSKPVAVVAPSSVVEKNNPEKEICKADSTEPVIKESDDIAPVDFDDNSGKLDSISHLKGSDSARPTGMLEALLTRKDPSQLQRNSDLTQNNHNSEKRKNGDAKVSGGDQKSGNDSKRTSPAEHAGSYPGMLGGFDPLRPDGLYSMIHSLAACEHKFLTALYMNSLMSAAVATPPGVMHPPALGFGFPPAPSYFVGYENSALAEACRSSLVANNAPIMNNLLSFADTQHRLWQMVNWQQDRIGPNTADTCNTTVSSTVDPERRNSITPEPAVSSIVIPMPHLMTSVPMSDGSMLPQKPKPHPKRSSSLDQKNSTSSATEGSKAQDSGQTSNNQDKKKPHIKKPLNAFMLYMKEMRAKVVAECTLKESAAINQILGRRWHSLTREEQAKYYEKARQERQLHMQLYPGWSARDNYGYGAKKKKRKKERSADPGGNSMKKCRARYGLDQQSQWCKPCSPDGPSHGNPPGHPPGHPPGPGPNPTGLGVHASIIHHGNTTTSNAASPQEPTYVNL